MTNNCNFLALSIAIAATVLPQSVAAQTSDTDPAAFEQFEELVREQERLIAEAMAVEDRLRDLARQIRAQRRAASAVAIADLAPVIAQLDSDDFDRRTEATNIIRRTLLQRLWQLGEEQDLSAEAQARLHGLLIETAALSQLAPIMLRLGADDRGALFVLMDAEPGWVASALGHNAARVQQAMQRPPEAHDDAVAIITAHLLSDPLRPYPQFIALESLRDVSHPMVREAVVALIRPLPAEEVASMVGAHHLALAGPNWMNAFSNQQSVAALALEVVRRHRMREALPWLVGLLERMQSWNNQVVASLVSTVISFDDKAAAAPLYEAAQQLRERYKNSRWGDEDRFNMRPGDNLMYGVAVLLELDPAELGFVDAAVAGWGGVNGMYGFVRNESRDDAFAAIEARLKESEPFDAIPGMDDATRELDALIGPIK